MEPRPSVPERIGILREILFTSTVQWKMSCTHSMCSTFRSVSVFVTVIIPEKVVESILLVKNVKVLFTILCRKKKTEHVEHAHH